MHHRMGRIGALAAILLMAGIALAQQPFPFGGFGSFGKMGSSMLLNMPDVQKELNLTDEQATKVKEVRQQVREKYKDDFATIFQDKQFDKIKDLIQKVTEETDKAMLGVLKPDQQKRLGQIELQARGSEAFADPEVQKKLGLSDQQKDQIKTISDDAAKELQSLFKNAKDIGDFQEAFQKMKDLRKDADDRVASVLNDAQKSRWKEMIGTPFELKFRFPGKR
jgi:hypothetical protein